MADAAVDGDVRRGPPEQNVDEGERKLAEFVTRRWRDCDDELMKARRHFWQNLAFFSGEQWVTWDGTRNQLTSLAQTFSPLGPGRARLTINQVKPNINSVLSRLMHSPLQWDNPPNDSSDDQIAAARLAEQIIRAEQFECDWEAHRYDELFGVLIGGTSAVAWEWDASAGEQIEIDGTTGRVVGTGRVRLQAMNVTEFGLQPGVRDYRDANWWIMGLAMAPEIAKQRYGLKWTPDTDASAMRSPLQQRVLRDSGRQRGADACLVLTLYERPNPDAPKGRYICVINDRVVHKSDWPFPHKRLNIRPFRQARISGQWPGTTYMNDAVPIQFAYNHARSLIHEHMKKVGNARLMAPFGSFSEEDFTNAVGDIVWFSSDGTGSIPQYLRPPDLPRWMLAEADTLKAELDDIMHVHATSRGEASFDRASGQALAILAEKDDSPLGLMAHEQAQGWAEIANAVLEIYEKKATERRKATLKGDAGVPIMVAWTGKDIKGQRNVRVPLEVVTPRSKAAMQSFARDLWDRQIITDPYAFARLSGVSEEELVEVMDADVGRAQRENARMANGVPELVEDFDDHAKHIAEHNRWRKSDSYRYATEDIRSIFNDHLLMHERMAAEEYGAQVRKADVAPGFAAVPQAHEPPGSMVPPDYAEQMAMMGGQGGGGAMGAPQPGGGDPAQQMMMADLMQMIQSQAGDAAMAEAPMGDPGMMF
jgi:hypothetical protein